MAIDLHDEILQDFLVEAGETLEQLHVQLIALKQTPGDSDLLHSIFRGFHTIKGGGSFLALTHLVEVCHQSEDVFNLLRNQELLVNAPMVDLFLQILDVLRRMFEEIHSGIDPRPAKATLLQQLTDMQQPEGLQAVAEKAPAEVPQPKTGFCTKQAPPAVDTAQQIPASDDENTEASFEALLDALQGPGDMDDHQKHAEHAVSAPILGDDRANMLRDAFTVLPTRLSALKPKTVAAAEHTSHTPLTADGWLDQPHDPRKASHPKIAKPFSDSAESVESSRPLSYSTPNDETHTTSRQSETIYFEPGIRVDTVRFEAIMNLIGELVFTRNCLNRLKSSTGDERMHVAISRLDGITGDLQLAMMKVPMQPVQRMFARFPCLARDLAQSLKKEVSLEIVGEDTDLDKNLVEALAEPLMHLIRNSVDHGIELPHIRETLGKPRAGKIVLAARQEGDHILLSISDDGAGMNPAALRNTAIEKGLMDRESATHLDDNGCLNLIFMPGFTTREQISDLSGRGVGMDLVKTKITQLKGNIRIHSKPGKGTLLYIKVPRTLMILPALLVRLGNCHFALPLSDVREVLERNARKTSRVDGRAMVLNRGKSSPVFDLRHWLLADAGQASDESTQIIMVEADNAPVGLVVDQVTAREDVIIKPLDRLLRGLPGMAGSTITGDGNIAIILNLRGLLKHHV